MAANGITVSANWNEAKMRPVLPAGGNALPQQTFAIAADASIEIDGKPAKLGDVPIGAGVVMRLSSDQTSERSAPGRPTCTVG
jgi:hypothetical protein